MVGSSLTFRRSSSDASSHQTTSGSVSCVPEAATETRRVVRRIAEWLALACASDAPTASTRKPGTPSRASDARTKSGTVPRSSAMISAPALRKMLEQPLAERELRRFVGRREEALAAVLQPAVGAIEADEVIDAVAVEEIGAAPRALAEPAEILRRHRRPSGRAACPSPARWR